MDRAAITDAVITWYGDTGEETHVTPKDSLRLIDAIVALLSEDGEKQEPTP